MYDSLRNICTFQLVLEDTRLNHTIPAAGSPCLTRVAGFDARNLSIQDTYKEIAELGFTLNTDKIYKREGYMPSPTQLACAVGHRLAWRLMLSTGDPYALILEEDAVQTGINVDIDAATTVLQGERPAVVQLSCRSEIFPLRREASKAPINGLVELRYPPRQTTAYLINRQAAVLGASSPLDGLADWPGFATQVDFWALLPWMFRESGETSTVNLGTGGLASISKMDRIVHALPLNLEHLYRVSLPTLDSWLWRKRGMPRDGIDDQLWRPSVPNVVVSAAKRLARITHPQECA